MMIQDDQPYFSSTGADDDNKRKPSTQAAAPGLNLSSRSGSMESSFNFGDDDSEDNLRSSSRTTNNDSNNKQIHGSKEGLLPADVICARNRMSHNHPGNARYQATIKEYRDEYQKSCVRQRKNTITRTIIQSVKDYGGRFVKFDNQSKTYKEVGPEAEYEKVSHALRLRTKDQKGATTSLRGSSRSTTSNGSLSNAVKESKKLKRKRRVQAESAPPAPVAPTSSLVTISSVTITLCEAIQRQREAQMQQPLEQSLEPERQHMEQKDSDMEQQEQDCKVEALDDSGGEEDSTAHLDSDPNFQRLYQRQQEIFLHLKSIPGDDYDEDSSSDEEQNDDATCGTFPCDDLMANEAGAVNLPEDNLDPLGIETDVMDSGSLEELFAWADEKVASSE